MQRRAVCRAESNEDAEAETDAEAEAEAKAEAEAEKNKKKGKRQSRARWVARCFIEKAQRRVRVVTIATRKQP